MDWQQSELHFQSIIPLFQDANEILQVPMCDTCGVIMEEMVGMNAHACMAMNANCREFTLGSSTAVSNVCALTANLARGTCLCWACLSSMPSGHGPTSQGTTQEEVCSCAA